MKRIITLLTLFTLALTACGTSQNASPSQLPEVTQAIATAMNTIGPTSSNATTPADSGALSAVQLAIGTLKLEGTGQAVTATQAATLMSLWSTLKSIDSQAMPQGNPQQGNQQSIVTPGNDIAIQQQVDAQVKQIQGAMTAAQDMPIEHDTAPYPGAERQHDHVGDAAPSPCDQLTETIQARIVFYRYRKLKAPAQHVCQREANQS